MAKKVKRASMYIGGQKLAECSTSGMRINTNTERLHMQEGVDGGSDGNMEIDFTFDMIVCMGFPGASKRVKDAIMKQEEVELGFFWGGTFTMAASKFQTADIRSDNRNGTLTGSFSAINVEKPTEA